MPDNGTGTWLTQDAFDRLSGELAHLSGEGRVDIAKKIEAARAEGDLRENGGYHAAKEEQGKQEARIRQLRHILDTAQVGEPPVTRNGEVASGMVITVELGGSPLTFLLGSREVSGDTDLDVYSEASPLGSAIVGRTVGDETSFTAPTGKEVPVRIVETRPFTG